MSFAENVVILTGASSGIGEAMAYYLARQGAWLSLAARNEAKLNTVAENCRSLGGRALVVITNVIHEEQCQALIEKTVAEYGRIDTLINNAGLSMGTRLDEVESLAPLEYIMQVNFFGSMYCTYYALPYLKESQGRIVAVSSITGRTGVPMRTAYAASKHAMVGFFESLRIELEDDGVTVTIAFPDFVSSGFHLNSLGPDGQPLGLNPLKSDKVMDRDTCAAAIVDAAAGREREIILSRRARLGQWLKIIAPTIPDKLVKDAIRKGH